MNDVSLEMRKYNKLDKTEKVKKKSKQWLTEQAYVNPSFSSRHDPLDPHLPMVNMFKNFDIPLNFDDESRNLMIMDAVMLVIDYIQMFALILSMSLRWPWPDTWTKTMSFSFFFNLDFWDFSKRVSSPYVAARDNYISSDEVPFNFMAYISIWFVALVALTGVTYWIFKFLKAFKNSDRKLLRLKQVFIFLIQAIALPTGIQIAKLFWCLPFPEPHVLDVENSVSCGSAGHVFLVLIGTLLLIPLFFGFPFFLYRSIFRQVISSDAYKHETYLRVKHFENLTGIDSSWIENSFIHFASFTRFWAFFRPLNQLFKFFIVLFYGSMFNSRLWQVSLMFAMFSVLLTIFAFYPPYRITSFNFLICWNYFCIICMLIIGLMQNISGVQTVFLIPTYIQVELILINIAWLLGTLLCLVYFRLRWRRRIFPQAEFFPFLFKRDYVDIGSLNKRLVFVAVSARRLLSRCVHACAILCPTHELRHHIDVIDKLLVDADTNCNPLRTTLRSVVDELAETYNRYAAHSIFTHNKPVTAATLSLLLPDFSRRLHARDVEMILVAPHKRRILLKLLVVACFIDAGKRRGGGEGIRGEATRRVWRGNQHRALVLLDQDFRSDGDDYNADFLERAGLLANRRYYDEGSNYDSTSC